MPRLRVPGALRRRPGALPGGRDRAGRARTASGAMEPGRPTGSRPEDRLVRHLLQLPGRFVHPRSAGRGNRSAVICHRSLMHIVHWPPGRGDVLRELPARATRWPRPCARPGQQLTVVPVYTPLRTDEPAESSDAAGLRRHQRLSPAALGPVPPHAAVRRSPAGPPGLAGPAGRARRGGTRPEQLGPLTVSMLRGQEGRQRKELRQPARMARRRAARRGPSVHRAAGRAWPGRSPQRLGVPVVGTLSGEDLFLEQLAAAALRRRPGPSCDAAARTWPPWWP